MAKRKNRVINATSEEADWVAALSQNVASPARRGAVHNDDILTMRQYDRVRPWDGPRPHSRQTQ